MKVDLCIIGAGSGGLSIAAGAAQLGVSVALIENGKMGGDCLNYGCVPSKSVLAAAKRAKIFRTSSPFGLQAVDPKVDFIKLHQHIQKVIKTIAPHDSAQRFEKLGVHVIREKAVFLSPKILQAGKYKIEAKYYVIATGSSPAIPPIAGLETVNYLTNETIFKLKEKPDHLIVVGGGPIGCELAQAYSLLGVKTTILEAFSLLPKEDPEVIDVLRGSLKEDGVEILEGAQVTSISQSKNRIKVSLGKKVIEGSHLLIATGRKANVEGLGLERAGIRYTSRGIEVDQRLRTSQKKIFALGDVIGQYQFTHVAAYHAQVVLKNCLFHIPTKVDMKALPWVTFTDPEIAHVGVLHSMTPSNSRTLQWPYAECDRAQTEKETKGFIKVIISPKGRILAVSIVGANAGELILPWVLAIKKKMTLRGLADVIVPYPTLSELTKKVAGSFYTPLLFSPWMRKFVQFLMRVFP